MSTYLESSYGEMISEKRVLREMITHDVTSSDEQELFFQECKPCHKTGLYKAEELLCWLGY